MGKKSWNVYNRDNVAKVRRDEAEARLREEEQERRMQEVDAGRRLQLLRGEHPDPLPVESEHDASNKRQQDDGVLRRKKRRVAGEDDTDRDMRLAREAGAVPAAESGPAKHRDASLVDHKGHINLFPEDPHHAEKNSEAQSEAAKRRREFEDQYTMRFSNAAGFKQTLESPWYSASQSNEPNPWTSSGKDVWGNEDPKRREREQKRLDSSDPLAAMKMAVKKLRQADRHRKEWMDERERDLTEVEDMARGNQRRREREDDDESDSLRGFSLETTRYAEKRRERRKHRSGLREEGRRERHHRSERHKQEVKDERSYTIA